MNGLSQEIRVDGDDAFLGFVSRQNPVTLKPGYLQYSQNMRLDRGVATTRRGTKRLASSSVVNQPIFAACSFSLPSDGIDKVLMAGSTRLFEYNTGDNTVTVRSYPDGRTIKTGDRVHMFQALDKAYILRGEATSGTRSCAVTFVDGTAFVELSGHGFTTGDEVTIYGCDQTDYNGSHVISVDNEDTFRFICSGTPDSPATGSPKAVRCKPALSYDGEGAIVAVSHAKGFDITDASFPPANFGLYFCNRIVVRKSRDTIAVSDYLDPSTWDQTLGVFQLNLGDNDEIVGFTPWDENKFLIFKRRAIYLAYLENTYDGTGQADLGANSYVVSVTDQVGCAARQTIANAGQAIFFLSDSGVRVLDPQLDLKLLGNSRPLSDPISDIIERINLDAVGYSCGKIFNNRYYLAVPLDGSLYNNAILVYNLLNQAWESVDIYPDGVRFDGLLVAKYSRGESDCDPLDPGIGCMTVEVDFKVR